MNEDINKKNKINKKNNNKKKFIGRRFEAVHRSRELAVQFLYSIDVYPEQDFNSSLEMFLNLDDVAKNDAPEVKKRCRDLAVQVWNRKNEIDGVLLRVVTGWRPERIVSVDKTILRLLVFEGFLEKNLPVKSAISEAVRLANDFGTKESARFINGVLCKVEKFFDEEEHN